ncbi:MAG TPA: molybdopterin-dependent oxidoreductase [Bryobacteraceae bacterium]|nr:molybdopterin-dependent oxidoreductase [Bryobacteraceae bacterium]
MRKILSSALYAILGILLLQAAEPSLRIEGVSGRDGVAKPALTLTLSDLAGMPRTKVQVRTHDNQDHTYEGVPLFEILKRAGVPSGEALRGTLLTRYLVMTAHDGYRVLFSLPELDPAFSDTHALLADRMDGAPLPSQQGPFRLVIPGEKREARWIRMVERIDVLSAPEAMR